MTNGKKPFQEIQSLLTNPLDDGADDSARPAGPAGGPEALRGDDHRPSSVAEQFLPMFLEGRKHLMMVPTWLGVHVPLDLVNVHVQLDLVSKNRLRLEGYRRQRETRQRRPNLVTPRYHDQDWTQRWAVYLRVRGVSDGE